MSNGIIIPLSKRQGILVEKSNRTAGKIFGITLSQAAAKSIAGVALTQQAGRALVANLLKAIPGAGTILGSVISASTAVALTEALGWIVADDFFRLYNGEEPENIV